MPDITVAVLVKVSATFLPNVFSTGNYYLLIFDYKVPKIEN